MGEGIGEQETDVFCTNGNKVLLDVYWADDGVSRGEIRWTCRTDPWTLRPNDHNNVAMATANRNYCSRVNNQHWKQD